MSPKSVPLRTALIGLSSTATTSWASQAHLPGLLTQIGRSKLPIHALLNSSVHAAKSAAEEYKLGPNTKTYGSPEELANDPDIDVVICNTRVDRHYETILPSIRKGKDVFVEWPIAANINHVQSLVQEARKSGSRVAVGLQGRWAAPVVKVREMVEKGDVGKILSVDVRGFGGSIDRSMLPQGLKYFAQKEIGGNPITIGFGHVFDFVLSVVGDIDAESVKTTLQIQRPHVKIQDAKDDQNLEPFTSDVPDLLTLNGPLKRSAFTSPFSPPTISFLFRRGQPFPGTPALTWTINCEHGEIRLVSTDATSLQAGVYEDKSVTIHVHTFDNDEVKEVGWQWPTEQAELPRPARNVSHCLYAFADGKSEGDGWVGLESAAARAKLIDSFFQTSSI